MNERFYQFKVELDNGSISGPTIEKGIIRASSNADAAKQVEEYYGMSMLLKLSLTKINDDPVLFISDKMVQAIEEFCD